MRAVLVIVLMMLAAEAFAGDPPDSLAVSKLYSTSWVLTERFVIRKHGFYHPPQKVQES